MNIKQFKNLIKECVRDVIREELPDILAESQQNVGKTFLNENQEFSFNSGDIVKSQGVDPNTVRNQLRSKMGAAFGIQGFDNQYKDLKVQPQSENPWMDFILDAGANMTPQDKAGLRNLGD